MIINLTAQGTVIGSINHVGIYKYLAEGKPGGWMVTAAATSLQRPLQYPGGESRPSQTRAIKTGKGQQRKTIMNTGNTERTRGMLSDTQEHSHRNARVRSD